MIQPSYRLRGSRDMEIEHKFITTKSSRAGARKFLEPAATRGAISLHPQSITDLRGGVEERRSSREVKRSTFARFLGLFDFRLLQQYLPIAEVNAPTYHFVGLSEQPSDSGTHKLAANKSHLPGNPLSSYDPRSTNFKPAPATRSVTTLETNTSLGAH